MKKYGLLFSVLLFANACEAVNFKGIGTIGNKYINLRAEEDLSTTLVLSVVAAAIAIKIGYDLSWQSTYSTKTNHWYKLLTCTIERNHITSIIHPKLNSLFSAIDHDEIVQMQIWVDNAYNNWLTPWNWTNDLKDSFQKLQIIEILTLYADLVAKEDNISGIDVVKSFRNKYGNSSIYPLIFAYNMMNNHVQLIAQLGHHPFQGLLAKMTDSLNNFKVLLRQENEYQQEVQAKRMAELQQELINATRMSR